MSSSSKLLSDYVFELKTALEAIPTSVVEKVGDLIFSIIPNGTVFVAGNGGSAATASHLVTDLGVGSLRRKNPVRAVSLCENTSVVTATSNDLDFSEIFSQQLQLLGKKGDIFVAISASGNSKNLIHALNTAKTLNMITVSITGFNGGEISKIADICIHVPTKIGSYGVVEDSHLSICHMITELVRNKNV